MTGLLHVTSTHRHNSQLHFSHNSTSAFVKTHRGQSRSRKTTTRTVSSLILPQFQFPQVLPSSRAEQPIDQGKHRGPRPSNTSNTSLFSIEIYQCSRSVLDELPLPPQAPSPRSSSPTRQLAQFQSSSRFEGSWAYDAANRQTSTHRCRRQFQPLLCTISVAPLFNVIDDLWAQRVMKIRPSSTCFFVGGCPLADRRGYTTLYNRVHVVSIY